MQAPRPPDHAEVTARQRDETAHLADEVAALNARLGLPATLREMGVVEQMIEPLVPQAVADHTTATNPRPLDADAYRRLFMETLG